MAFSILRTLKTDSPLTQSARSGSKRALKLFHEAAQRVPAYKDFLRKHRIDPRSVKTPSDFAKLPVTDKPTYMSAYDLKDLSWDGSLAIAKCVSTSSGSTGAPHFWPRGHQHDTVINMMIQKMYEDIIGTGTGSTLAVDSFALGQWIAGFEFYNATRWTAERGNHIVIVTPGIDKVEAANEIKKLASYFDRVVIAGYPPFVKDIVEQGALVGIDWPAIDVHFIAGGEAVSDVWKDRLLERIGRSGEIQRFVTEYGMAEAGVVAHETPVSAIMRRALPQLGSIEYFPKAEEVTALYQYYPNARYFEKASDGSLALTADAGLPLIRYDTRDVGGTLDYEDAISLGGNAVQKMAARYNVDLGKWKLPFVYLQGRKDFSISLYALNIYVENVKRALEGSAHAALLSGLFTMTVEQTQNLDQQFEISVELVEGTQPNTALAESLADEIVATLSRLNTEYAKLYSAIGTRARPHVTLLGSGEIQTIRGRKHKWFRKS